MNQLPKVTIIEANPAEREGAFKNDKGENVQFKTRKQAARLEVNGFAYPYDVRLEDGQKPYPLGDYTLDLGAMVEVNKKAINMAKYPVLRPVAAGK